MCIKWGSTPRVLPASLIEECKRTNCMHKSITKTEQLVCCLTKGEPDKEPFTICPLKEISNRRFAYDVEGIR
jgi:hypothetical protein